MADLDPNPWWCRWCLVRACHRCTGTLIVHTLPSLAAGRRGREELCWCTRKHPTKPASEPAPPQIRTGAR